MLQSYVDLCINGCLELESLYRTAQGTQIKKRPDSRFLHLNRNVWCDLLTRYLLPLLCLWEW